MILTCPQCASRYDVDGASIPPQGRTVRCVACATTWRALPEGEDAPLMLKPAEPASSAEPERAKPGAAEIPKAIRAERKARQQTRKALAAGAVWGMLGALLLAVLGGALLFRIEVVKLWPRTAGAYAKVGLPVNPTGLTPENIQAGPGLKDGRAAVIVSGVVRNIEAHENEPTPLRVALLDKAGKPLVDQLVEIEGGAIAPGQTRPFSATFFDPPTDSANVQVEFALDHMRPRKAAKGHGADKGHGDAAHGEAHAEAGHAPAHGEAGHEPAQGEAHGETHQAADAHGLRGPAEPAPERHAAAEGHAAPHGAAPHAH